MNYVKMTPPKMAQYRFGGWAEKYLDKMLEGLTGNLNSLFYPFKVFRTAGLKAGGRTSRRLIGLTGI